MNTRNITDVEIAGSADTANVLVDDNGVLKKFPASSLPGGGGVDEAGILDKVTDPDKYAQTSGGGEQISPVMEVGGLDRSTGALKDNTGYSRTAEFIPVQPGIEYTFANDAGNKMCVMCYDANEQSVENIGNGSYRYIYVESGATWSFSDSYGISFIKFYVSKTADLTIPYTITWGGSSDVVDPLSFKKMYFPNGYSIEASEIDPGLWQLLIHALRNEFNIVGIRAPEAKPHEATLALLCSGDSTNQFADLSCMRYDESAQGQVCLILQKRGEATPLPYFFIGFNDGVRPPRVQKFRVNPDCIPMRMTSQGIEVRRNNTYDNDWLPEETVVVNLADMHDKVEKMYAALVANGTITE